jgi:hypothetical protein
VIDPAGVTARRFPLVARPRPRCLPLPARVRALEDLALAARPQAYHGVASSAFNQAALLASDLGLPELARQWCHQATAYLNQYPLSGMDAIRGLEPLVNLARLDIRASLQIGEYAPDLIDQVGHITNGDVPEDVKIDLEITVYHAIAGRDDLPPGH